MKSSSIAIRIYAYRNRRNHCSVSQNSTRRGITRIKPTINTHPISVSLPVKFVSSNWMLNKKVIYPLPWICNCSFYLALLVLDIGWEPGTGGNCVKHSGFARKFRGWIHQFACNPESSHTGYVKFAATNFESLKVMIAIKMSREGYKQNWLESICDQNNCTTIS